MKIEYKDMTNLVSRRNNTSGKSKILFILHLPPPVHGAAMVGKYIHDSELINSELDCSYINLTTASSLEDIGKVGLRKLTAFVRLLVKIRIRLNWQKSRRSAVSITFHS